MTASIRALLNLGLVCISLVVVLGMIPMNDTSEAWDCRGLPDLLRLMMREQRREATLDSSLDAILRRTAEKEKITHELLARRITLREASARFQALSELGDGSPIDYRNLYAGVSDEERSCREVMSWACSIQAMTSRREAAAVARQLEAELQHYLETEGASGKESSTR